MNLNKYQFWRLVAICAATIFSTFLVVAICALPPEDKLIYLYILIPLGLLMLYSIIHQLRFPLDLRIYVIWSLVFSNLSVSYGYIALAFLIFACAFFLGKEIRFFTTHKKLKIIFICLGYAVSATFHIIKFWGNFDVLSRSAMELIVGVSTFITMSYITKHLFKRINKDIFEEVTKENITDYFEQNNFSERDKVMLQEVLSGCKYEEIAINHNLSLSSVKKRLAYLYKMLGVTCQIDFIIKFSPKNS